MRVITVFLGFFYVTNIQAQIPVHISCNDPKFDQEVKTWLQFSIPIISAKQLAEAQSNYTILDAREPAEYTVSHIPGAHLIGYDHFKLEQLPAMKPNDRIVVYCSIGYRSEKIAEKLKKAGYKQVYNLYGGIFEWVNSHHPVVNPRKEVIHNVHTYNQKWSKWLLNPLYRKVWEN